MITNTHGHAVLPGRYYRKHGTSHYCINVLDTEHSILTVQGKALALESFDQAHLSNHAESLLYNNANTDTTDAEVFMRAFADSGIPEIIETMITDADHCIEEKGVATHE